MNNKKILRILGLIALVMSPELYQKLEGFAPTTLLQPYDPVLRLPPAPEKCPLRVGANVEWGSGTKGYNASSDKSNVLRLYNDTQSTLAMFEQPTNNVATTSFIALRNALRVVGGAARPGAAVASGAFDDGTRGHLRFTGEFEGGDITPHVRYILPASIIAGELAINAQLPIRWAQVRAKAFEDLTGSTLATGAVLPATDQFVQATVTTTIKTIAQEFGNVDLNNWEASNLGDLVVMLDWLRDYPQEKESLKNVELHARLGLRCPTGLKKDENKVFSLAFGNDGAWSIPFGLGLDLDFKSRIGIGADAEFEIIFDDTKERRMKTHASQTEYLLLNKGKVTTDHGLLWKFYLYLQGFHFYRGLSLKAAYEYIKKDSDSLSPKSDDFNASVANSARWLDEWNSHHAIFSLNYDFFKEFKSIKPQLSVYYKVPISGKGIIAPDTFGGQISISF